MRVTLIHALRHSPPPIEAAFNRMWPEAALRNLLDDGLSADLARDGGITPAMTQRFVSLTDYAVQTGAEAILFTCSAFGPCIEACAAVHPRIPILKPNEAMIDELVALAGPVGLLASFAPTLQSMPAEFPPEIDVMPCLAEGALERLTGARPRSTTDWRQRQRDRSRAARPWHWRSSASRELRERSRTRRGCPS